MRTERSTYTPKYRTLVCHSISCPQSLSFGRIIRCWPANNVAIFVTLTVTRHLSNQSGSRSMTLWSLPLRGQPDEMMLDASRGSLPAFRMPMTWPIFQHPLKCPIQSIPLMSLVIATIAFLGSCLMATVGIPSGPGASRLGGASECPHLLSQLLSDTIQIKLNTWTAHPAHSLCRLRFCWSARCSRGDSRSHRRLVRAGRCVITAIYAVCTFSMRSSLDPLIRAPVNAVCLWAGGSHMGGDAKRDQYREVLCVHVIQYLNVDRKEELVSEHDIQHIGSKAGVRRNAMGCLD
ncbi:hypothetical protein EVAR_98195_1 [Eumeta japonica]|uniref:Uncharacterized protein n=1 Tax=Eumeta variegata TaxID=151549 RepID=A0A4C1Y870_EUMVA|nr:hypothetical protein EVAR_98195_1 [Eumeta japonica]